MSSSRIVVDVAALSQLETRLRIVSQSLESDVGMFDNNANGVEHARLRRSLGDFEDDWSDKRNKISENLEHIKDGLHESIKAFQDADSQLEGLLGGASTSGGGGSWK